jgi:beta-galactosidase
MERLPFNQSWRFHLGEPVHDRHQPLDDSTWRVVDLPHDWSIELPIDPASPSRASNGFFPMGRGWYRKTFQAPSDWQGKQVFIEFEGVYMNAEVWLNENLLGRHPYGYTSFAYDLTPYLKPGEANLLAVSVDNDSQLNSRWYSGSGLYRPVWLLVAGPLHLAHWGVSVTTAAVTEAAATVRIASRLQNLGSSAALVSLRQRIYAPGGALAGQAEASAQLAQGGQAEIVQEIELVNPQLWSCETPQLHRLETELLASGQVIDRETTAFGVRWLEFSAASGFRLNGREIKLRGGCVHHDDGVLGAASYRRSEERKVEQLKASGFNAIRCAHNPPAPAFLEACDRLGMLVIDEAFDCWRMGKNPYDYHVAFEDWWQRDLDSMLLRDRNHPSIVLWSIGNEVGERNGGSGGAALARQLAEHVRALDPTRPVLAAINGGGERWPWEATDAVFAALDVGGYNYQWRQYQQDHQRHPERMMIGTESFPLEALDNWLQVEQNSFVLGDFVWTSLDYLGEAGIGRVHFEGEKAAFLGDYPWNQAYCGDLDLCGFKRPQSYYRDMVWQRGHPLYIAVHTPLPPGKTPTITPWGWPDVWPDWNWPGLEGQNLKVEVYSACERVELLLNGQSFGSRPTTRQERLSALFEVPYAPGELKAVGYNGEAQIAEFIIHTAQSPTRLRLSPDRPTLQAAAGDLCFVTVEVLDAQGRVHPKADQTIYFTVKGPGVIAAVGNGHPASPERYTGNQRRAHHGRALVVVKTTGQPGQITLTAQADGLDGAEVVLSAEL